MTGSEKQIEGAEGIKKQGDGMRIEGLQYQLANGNWVDCDERTYDFLALCVKHDRGCTTVADVIKKLETGDTVRNDSADWYSKCRIKPTPRPAVKIEMVRCSCGCSVPRGLVMNASLGTSCPDCYDEMSG